MNITNIIFIVLAVYFIYTGVKQLQSGFSEKDRQKMEAKYTKESIEKYSKVSGIGMIVVAIIQIAICVISFIFKENNRIEWILLGVIVVFAIGIAVMQKVICKEKDADDTALPEAEGNTEAKKKEKEFDEDLENSDQ